MVLLPHELRIARSGNRQVNEMKNLYEIKSKNGAHVCYQAAISEKKAVYAAKNYYGFKSASSAVFVRENA